MIARCALEADDSGDVRIEKILAIIDQCKLGIHDISRTELNEHSLPRFNMPLELGLFLGASRFGQGKTKKITLIVDSELIATRSSVQISPDRISGCMKRIQLRRSKSSATGFEQIGVMLRFLVERSSQGATKSSQRSYQS